MDADGSIIDICNVIDAAPYLGFVNVCPRLYPPNQDGFQSLHSALKDQVSKMGFDLIIGRTQKTKGQKSTFYVVAPIIFSLRQVLNINA